MRHLLKTAFASVCVSTVMWAAPIAGTSPTTLPKLTGPIPITADSFPLMAANRTLQPMDLKKIGYVEEEFIVSGTANVYDWAADGSLTVKTPNAPYATRILVRRPADASRFSGHAVVELLNTARRFDWGMMSGYLRDELIEHGDAWVGVTLPGGVKSLPKFNAARYAGVAFDNPNPSEACPMTSDQEEGLRWDMLSQLGAALKSDTGLRAKYVYMTAQGLDIITYLNAIQPHATLENGKPVYDGYLIKGPASVGRLRRCGTVPAKEDPRQKINNAGVAVIQVVAQGEVAEDYRRPDSDIPQDRYRLYEIAGIAHIDKYAYSELPSMADQMAALGTPGQGTADWPFAARCEPEIALQDNPLFKYILHGAMLNLEQWVSKGIAPPKAERISLAGITDQFGVAMGGVRSPYADFPAARYFTTTPGPATCRELGRTVPLDWARLEVLYGNHQSYAAKIGQATDRMVKEHWLTESDAQKIKVGQ